MASLKHPCGITGIVLMDAPRLLALFLSPLTHPGGMGSQLFALYGICCLLPKLLPILQQTIRISADFNGRWSMGTHQHHCRPAITFCQIEKRTLTISSHRHTRDTSFSRFASKVLLAAYAMRQCLQASEARQV